MFSFWGVDALKPDLVLGVVIKDGNGVVVRYLDDFPGGGIGEGRGSYRARGAKYGIDNLDKLAKAFNVPIAELFRQ